MRDAHASIGERAATVTSTPRVVHVVPAEFGGGGVFGGAERYAMELARFMSHRVPTTLVTFGPRTRHYRLDNLDVHVLRNWVNVRRFVLDPVNPGLLRYLWNADIIHYHQTYTLMSSYALMYARAAGTPIFTTNLGGGGMGLHQLTNIDEAFAGHLHISEFSRRAHGHAASPKADVIYGGVDVDRFSPDTAVARTNNVLYVGRLLPHKGINYLVDAVDADTPLLLAGRRWRHAARFSALLDERARGKRVEFREDLDDAAIVKAYRQALCIVLPSVFESVFGDKHTLPELLGQTLLEGMACGTPAITTSVASLPEVVEDGVTGFVVPPNDAAALSEKIHWLREHPAAAETMGQAARERVLKLFTWDTVVQRCLDIYRHAA